MKMGKLTVVNSKECPVCKEPLSHHYFAEQRGTCYLVKYGTNVDPCFAAIQYR